MSLQTPSSSQTIPKPNLPAPQTFDILPAIHELLSRIDHHNTSTLTDQPSPSTDPADLGALYAELQPLEPKDLSTEVLAVKAKIRKAVKELERLPDMGRSVAEQGEEIAGLEERIRRQKEMVGRLGELSKEFGGKGG